jgi:hypothetical protein
MERDLGEVCPRAGFAITRYMDRAGYLLLGQMDQSFGE